MLMMMLMIVKLVVSVLEVLGLALAGEEKKEGLVLPAATCHIFLVK